MINIIPVLLISPLMAIAVNMKPFFELLPVGMADVMKVSMMALLPVIVIAINLIHPPHIAVLLLLTATPMKSIATASMVNMEPSMVNMNLMRNVRTDVDVVKFFFCAFFFSFSDI